MTRHAKNPAILKRRQTSERVGEIVISLISLSIQRCALSEAKPSLASSEVSDITLEIDALTLTATPRKCLRHDKIRKLLGHKGKPLLFNCCACQRNRTVFLQDGRNSVRVDPTRQCWGLIAGIQKERLDLMVWPFYLVRMEGPVVLPDHSPPPPRRLSLVATILVRNFRPSQHVLDSSASTQSWDAVLPPCLESHRG